MAEYIEREAVETLFFIKRDEWRKHWIEYLEKRRATADYSTAEQAVDNWLRGYGEAVDDFLAICDNLPTADVVEVRHGEWIGHEGYEECNNCHHKALFCHKYCPNCGAKMDGKGDAE